MKTTEKFLQENGIAINATVRGRNMDMDFGIDSFDEEKNILDILNKFANEIKNNATKVDIEILNEKDGLIGISFYDAKKILGDKIITNLFRLYGYNENEAKEINSVYSKDWGGTCGTCSNCNQVTCSIVYVPKDEYEGAILKTKTK